MRVHGAKIFMLLIVSLTSTWNFVESHGSLVFGIGIHKDREDSSTQERDLIASQPSVSGFRSTIGPRFEEIGDNCRSPKPQYTTTVIPAYPGKQRFKSIHHCHHHPTYYSTGYSPSRATNSKYRSCNCPYCSAVNGSPNLGRSYGYSFDAPNAYNYLRSSSSSSLNEPEDVGEGGLSFDEQENIYKGDTSPAVPADPVSVSITYKNLLAPRIAHLINKQRIPEESLSFGPCTIPTDGHIHQRPMTTVPEEKLIIVENPIVELKTTHCGNDDSIEERDTDEDSLYTKKRSKFRGALTYNVLCNRKKVTAYRKQRRSVSNRSIYDLLKHQLNPIKNRDLGYDFVGPCDNKFVNTGVSSTSCSCSQSLPSVQTTEISSRDDVIPCGPLREPLPDYRPGRVVLSYDNHQDSTKYDSHNEATVDRESYDKGASCEKNVRNYENNHRYKCTDDEWTSKRGDFDLLKRILRP